MQEVLKLSLGENIRSRREELKLSQEYVAQHLRISRQAVSKWETGRAEPTTRNLIQLAEIFKISLSELANSCKKHEDQVNAEQG